MNYLPGRLVVASYNHYGLWLTAKAVGLVAVVQRGEVGLIVSATRGAGGYELVLFGDKVGWIHHDAYVVYTATTTPV